ncbi:uncharacterized protein [Primulina eburnea]|uniref:uncharacterized protein n=1 Tax=Primulina eburnea TaxID=1245227 RepID=UPI003C6C0C96
MAENPPQAFKQYILEYTLAHCDRANACTVQFSPDGLLIAVGSDPTVRTYIIFRQKPILHRVFSGHAGRVTDLSFSSDCRFLATSSYDTTVRLWDVSRGSLVRTLTGHNGIVSCVKFNRESDMIASGSFDETVRIWDVDTGACKKVIPAFAGHVTGVDFYPDASMIVACGLGGLCRIWDTATGKRIITVKKAAIPPVGSVMFSSDGKFVLIGNMDSTVMIWSMSRGMLYTRQVGHKNMTGLSTFLRADERYVVIGSEDNCLYIWEVMSGTLVQKIEAHTAPVLSVSCHPTRNMIATASFEDSNTVKIWTQDYSFVSDKRKSPKI